MLLIVRPEVHGDSRRVQRPLQVLDIFLRLLREHERCDLLSGVRPHDLHRVEVRCRCKRPVRAYGGPSYCAVIQLLLPDKLTGKIIPAFYPFRRPGDERAFRSLRHFPYRFRVKDRNAGDLFCRTRLIDKNGPRLIEGKQICPVPAHTNIRDVRILIDPPCLRTLPGKPVRIGGLRQGILRLRNRRPLPSCIRKRQKRRPYSRLPVIVRELV